MSQCNKNIGVGIKGKRILKYTSNVYDVIASWIMCNLKWNGQFKQAVDIYKKAKMHEF